MLIFCLGFTLFGKAQLDSLQIVAFQEQEGNLIKLGDQFINAEVWEERRDANYDFIKSLTQVLKAENSFAYDFPALKMVSIQKPSDNSFRIFTWQVETQGELVRHFGAIQMNSAILQLSPLLDRSDDIENIYAHSGSNEEWIGSLYYKIKPIKLRGKQAYLLFGLDTHSPFSKRKILELLHFNEVGQPEFGAPIFPNAHRPRLDNRFILEYRGTASVSMKYNTSLGKILFDHVIPVSNDQEGIYAYYVPDGTYDALVWDNNRFFYEVDVVATNYENLEDLKQNPNKGEKKSNKFYNSKSKGIK